MNTDTRRRLAAWCVLGVMVLSLLPCGIPDAAAEDPPPSPSGTSVPVEAGLGIASLLATIPYAAAKIGYALTGAVMGGLEYAYAGGKTKDVEAIWNSAMGGTYILTPDHLQGKKGIRFFGDTPEEQR